VLFLPNKLTRNFLDAT
jgi:hypothetical protein